MQGIMAIQYQLHMLEIKTELNFEQPYSCNYVINKFVNYLTRFM